MARSVGVGEKEKEGDRETDRVEVTVERNEFGIERESGKMGVRERERE